MEWLVTKKYHSEIYINWRRWHVVDCHYFATLLLYNRFDFKSIWPNKSLIWWNFDESRPFSFFFLVHFFPLRFAWCCSSFAQFNATRCFFKEYQVTQLKCENINQVKYQQFFYRVSVFLELMCVRERLVWDQPSSRWIQLDRSLKLQYRTRTVSIGWLNQVEKLIKQPYCTNSID